MEINELYKSRNKIAKRFWNNVSLNPYYYPSALSNAYYDNLSLKLVDSIINSLVMLEKLTKGE